MEKFSGHLQDQKRFADAGVMALIARNHPPYDPAACIAMQSIAGRNRPERSPPPGHHPPTNSRLFTRGTAQQENNYE
jgi:hypothetical protein